MRRIVSALDKDKSYRVDLSTLHFCKAHGSIEWRTEKTFKNFFCHAGFEVQWELMKLFDRMNDKQRINCENFDKKKGIP